jgi:CheY-like chemotaxis protein
VELLIGPGAIDRSVHAVVELGFFRRVGAAERQLMSRISEPLGVAVRASTDRTRLEELLEETQRQAEELQVQQEELRVSNEELEEQSRVLKESQARLETQQTELEQINSQLEEQTHALEVQKDDLRNAQVTLNAKATELERANQYKSEFLANMSHELRTPLNSLLILAKLLADNAHGNLTDEQVSYAQTIFSAGNELLALINDILDLSKIEAGKVDLRIESVSVAKLVADLDQTFQPMAQQKHLGFEASVGEGCPETIETDAQRLGQVLKNLLSNAFKFTETGKVTLRVSAGTSNTIRFEVRDTGIGIPLTQQAVVFEAFRQADGSTHRKHGGTGLGLSISRDLAHLLGGNISLWSVPGEGSAFTLTVPLVAPTHFVAPTPVPVPAPQMHAPAPRPPAAAAPAPAATAPAALQDDRDLLVPDLRRILVIEDDTRFAAVLRDLAHEMGFQCILTHSANDGLTAATSYSPSAIVLDVNLPDHSGLGVLDQLKRNPNTRHIPVHVVSVADYIHQALELGAIGYAVKPVQREDLVEAFRRLEAKAVQSLRRVLVVEDDEHQRESIGHLLGAGDVQITAVGTASEALAQLSATTFDCMVMDLKLPDFSGYELLEKMAAQEDVSFPPVIVYTGRSLSKDEEQRLGRFSRSIIIKDARSPERLLDEVTLFLHQVESALPPERQRMLKVARDRDTALEGRRILVVEDDARNIFALSSVLEPKGAKVAIARNGREAVDVLSRTAGNRREAIDLVLMDIMMPEMDGFTAMREIRKRPEWKKLPIIALTAKAMKDDQDKCLAAGANDYIAKPLDVEKLLSLVRVWMPNRA